MGGRETRPCDCEPAPRAPATWRDLWRRPRWRVVARALPWVVGVLLVGAIAVPNMRGTACFNWNDVSAYWTLTTVARSQDEFRRSGVLDLDGDGRAEFGSFRELSGAVPVRGGDRVLRPPVLSGAFRTLDAGDAVHRSGYRFRMYVPVADGTWVALDASAEGVSADGAETAFLCYAWPDRYGLSGKPSFVVDQTGVILRTDDARYSGARGPAPGAAPHEGGALSAGCGTDGNAWVTGPPQH